MRQIATILVQVISCVLLCYFEPDRWRRGDFVGASSFCPFMPSQQGFLNIPGPKSRVNRGGSILGKSGSPTPHNGVPALAQAQAPRDAGANP